MAGTPEVPSPSEIFLPPNVALTIVFGRHAKAEDVGNLQDFRQLVRSADIFIPEAIGWDEKTLQDARKISGGDSRTYQRYIPINPGDIVDYDRTVLSAMFNSKVKIQFVDVPSDHPLTQALESYKPGFDVPESIFQPTFTQTLAALGKWLRNEAQVQKQREDFILTQIGPRLQQIIAPHPRLSNKPSVSVVMLLGSYHTRVHDVLRQTIPPSPSGVPRVDMIALPSATEIQESTLKKNYVGNTLTEKEEQRLLAETLAKIVLNAISNDYGSMTYNFELEKGVRTLTDRELETVFESFSIKGRKIRYTPELLAVLQKIGADIFRKPVSS